MFGGVIKSGIISRHILIASCMVVLAGCQSTVHKYWHYEAEIFERNLGRVAVSLRTTRFNLGEGRSNFTEPYTLVVELYVKDDAERGVNIRVLSLESLGKSLVVKPLGFSVNKEDIRYQGSVYTVKYFVEIPGLFTAHESVDVKYEISHMGLTETFESRLEPKYWKNQENLLINLLKSGLP